VVTCGCDKKKKKKMSIVSGTRIVKAEWCGGGGGCDDKKSVKEQQFYEITAHQENTRDKRKDKTRIRNRPNMWEKKGNWGGLRVALVEHRKKKKGTTIEGNTRF